MRHSVGVVKTVTSIEAVERLSYLREGVVEYHEKDGEDESCPTSDSSYRNTILGSFRLGTQSSEASSKYISGSVEPMM